MKSKVVLHGNPYFLQDSHYTAMTMAIETNSALAVDEDGEKILKAGTVYPSNDASALGIVLKDVILDAERNVSPRSRSSRMVTSMKTCCPQK